MYDNKSHILHISDEKAKAFLDMMKELEDKYGNFSYEDMKNGKLNIKEEKENKTTGYQV